MFQPYLLRAIHIDTRPMKYQIAKLTGAGLKYCEVPWKAFSEGVEVMGLFSVRLDPWSGSRIAAIAK
jgi:hypothetical protein